MIRPALLALAVAALMAVSARAQTPPADVPSPGLPKKTEGFAAATAGNAARSLKLRRRDVRLHHFRLVLGKRRLVAGEGEQKARQLVGRLQQGNPNHEQNHKPAREAGEGRGLRRRRVPQLVEIGLEGCGLLVHSPALKRPADRALCPALPSPESRVIIKPMEANRPCSLANAQLDRG